MKKIAILTLLMMISTILFAADFAEIDKLFDAAQFDKAHAALMTEYNTDNTQASVIWRLGRYYYEIADKLPSKKEIVAKCDEGLAFVKPYMDTAVGEPADRARVIQWYDVLLSRRGQAKGVKESLDRIPDFFAFADKAIAICDTIPEPYHLKAMIDKELPVIVGGNKVRMSQNFMKAMEVSPNVIVFMVDAADGFIGRGWDAAKKVKSGDTYSPAGISDKEFAKQLLLNAKKIASEKSDLTDMEKDKMKLADTLLKKVN
ncbi:MAG: hypothetical protein IKQ61_00610 [Spirochaetales bacterium]|nr:hypothetical protein [Spirochaetales bacterium]